MASYFLLFSGKFFQSRVPVNLNSFGKGVTILLVTWLGPPNELYFIGFFNFVTLYGKMFGFKNLVSDPVSIKQLISIFPKVKFTIGSLLSEASCENLLPHLNLHFRFLIRQPHAQTHFHFRPQLLHQFSTLFLNCPEF